MRAFKVPTRDMIVPSSIHNSPPLFHYFVFVSFSSKQTEEGPLKADTDMAGLFLYNEFLETVLD
jgi:hypothetical protein